MDAKAAGWQTGFFRYWLPPVLWGALILLFSGEWGASWHTLGWLRWLLSGLPFLSPAQILALHYYLRKSAHVLAYGILYVLWFRAFQGHLGYRLRHAALFSLGLSLLLALTDEGHQTMLSSRSGSLKDVALDVSAALLAAGLSIIWWRTRARLKYGGENTPARPARP